MISPEQCERIRLEANLLLGLPYIWGGDNIHVGLDCSGLVQVLLATVGMDPPGDQTAQMLYNHFVNCPDSELGVKGCGALIFYGRNLNHITHVAMMLGNETLIEAGGGSRTTKTVEDAKKLNAMVRIRKHGHRKDELAIVKPNYKEKA